MKINLKTTKEEEKRLPAVGTQNLKSHNREENVTPYIWKQQQQQKSQNSVPEIAQQWNPKWNRNLRTERGEENVIVEIA